MKQVFFYLPEHAQKSKHRSRVKNAYTYIPLTAVKYCNNNNNNVSFYYLSDTDL